MENTIHLEGGKLQLVKSVLSSIPIYFMSCFKLPKWHLDRIDVIRRNFLWSRTGSTRTIHLLNWKTVCLPIKCGGMGVIDLNLQNIALMLRWLWRLYETDRKIWAHYATMLYNLSPNIDSPLILSKTGSFFWISLLNIKPLFHNCARFKVGAGSRVSFWYDTWAQHPLATMVNPPFPRKKISLLQAASTIHTLLTAPLTFDQYEAVQQLPHGSSQQGYDELKWNLTSSGLFSVSSTYKLLASGGKMWSATAEIWKAKVPPSVRCFFFLCIKDRLLTHDVMSRRNLPHQPGCVLCTGTQQETAVDLFFLCPYAQEVWTSLSLATGYAPLSIKDSISQTFQAAIPSNKDCHKGWLTYFISTMWFLWRERNERTFRGKRSPPFVLTGKIQREMQLFSTCC